MTTPGGVPNLPQGALTLATLASNLQDMTGDAMKSRAVERFPSIMNTSTGLDPVLEFTPFGILTRIWAEVNSLIANADPADIQGPEDLPELVLEFIEGLPVVGQFADLLEAILGTYTGTADVLLTVQDIFAPIRALVDAITALAGGGGFSDFTSFFDLGGSSTILGAITAPFQQLINGVTGGTTNPLSVLISSLTGTASTASTANTNASSALASIVSMISSLFGGSSILSQVQPSAVGGVTPGTSLLDDVGDFLTNLFNGITRNTATTATQAEASTALQGQTNIVLGTAASLAALTAGLGPGSPDSDDFERTSSTNLGAHWTTFFSSGTGPLATPNGHDLHYGGGSNTEWWSIKNDLQAASDDMEVTIVLAQAIPAWPYFTPSPFGGSIDVLLRCNLPGSYGARTGVYLRVTSAAYSASATLFAVTAGTVSNFTTWSLPAVPSTGSALTINVSGYDFEGLLDNNSLGGYTDAGHVSSKGAGFRYRGAGGKNTGGQGSPDLTGWTATG